MLLRVIAPATIFLAFTLPSFCQEKAFTRVPLFADWFDQHLRGKTGKAE